MSTHAATAPPATHTDEGDVGRPTQASALRAAADLVEAIPHDRISVRANEYGDVDIQFHGPDGACLAMMTATATAHLAGPYSLRLREAEAGWYVYLAGGYPGTRKVCLVATPAELDDGLAGQLCKAFGGGDALAEVTA